MPVPNPEYNPDWELIYDHHSAEAARLNETIEVLRMLDERAYKAGAQWDSDERLAIDRTRNMVLADIHRHHEACRNSFRMQHPTVQDYARWVFANFNPAPEGTKASVPAVDVEQFKSLDEVGQAWSQIERSLKDEATNKDASSSLRALAKGAGFKPR